jgi:hypothetical protein
VPETLPSAISTVGQTGHMGVVEMFGEHRRHHSAIAVGGDVAGNDEIEFRRGG